MRIRLLGRIYKNATVILITALMLLFGMSYIMPGGIVHAASDKLEVVGSPTVYVQSGGEKIVSIQVKNVSGSTLKGVNLAQGFSSLDDYSAYCRDEDYSFTHGSSERTATDPVYGEETWYRFGSYFEKSGYAAENAVWDSNEEGYTIATGKTAKLWFKVTSNSEEPGTYNEWIRLGDIHTELYGGFYPVPVVDEDYSGQMQVKVVTYNPQGAAITLGTSSNYGRNINTIALGSTIDFGTVDLSGSTGLSSEKTYFTRNTSTGYNNDITKDEHGASTDIRVELSVETPMLVQWSYDYPFSCNSYLTNGTSWAPLPAAPMTASSWQAAQTGITLDATGFVAGTYNATFRLSTVPHGVKVNGGSIHTNGIYEWPVKVKLTGTNPRIPKAPTNISATAGNGIVELSWKAASGADEYTSYDVYRREGSETAANINNLNNVSFNWDDYEYVGQDVADESGNCFFVDGSVTNEKTYTYVIIGGTPYQAYPAISGPVTPKSSLTAKLQAPDLDGGSDRPGGVILSWSMNENYGGTSNDGSSMVDHFNVYRDGVLIAQVGQNAVIESNAYGWYEVPAPTDEDPDAVEYRYGITRTEYSWDYFAETPIALQDYTFNVSAVSSSGVEGYLSKDAIIAGDTEDLLILGHTAIVAVNGSDVYADISLRCSEYNSPEKVSYWRAEGTAAPDTSQAPVYTYSRYGYHIDTSYKDETVKKGKTYTYAVQTEDGDGNKSNVYTFQIKVANTNDWAFDTYSDAVPEWRVIDGKSVRMQWYADTAYDDNGDWYNTGTYKVYRNGSQIKSFSPSGQSGGTMIVDDDPGRDGTYVYRVDTIINGITITGREYTFVRNTAAVDESSLLKAPGAPTFDVRVSDGRPVLRWAASEEGGAVEGYHIYRRDAGKLVNGIRLWSNYNQTIYNEPRPWDNMRYITISDPSINVLAENGGEFMGDGRYGYLESVSWYEDSCPHEYWITAYNAAGESEPSRIVSLTYDGEEGTPPSNSDDYAPGTPVINKLWMEWDEYDGSDWDSMIGGNLHVSWKDPAGAASSIDSWQLSATGLNGGEQTTSLQAYQAAQDPSATKGTSNVSPTFYVDIRDDLGRTANVTVTAVNSAGSSSSEAASLTITSFPRFKALEDNGSVKLCWTDLFNDNNTEVTAWQIWRKSSYGVWTNIKTIDASGLDYEKGASGNYVKDSNGVKNYSWRDESVTNGRTYQYRVTAVCVDDVDRPSVTREVTPNWNASTETPGAPQELTARKVSGEIHLSWKKPATGTPQYYQVMTEVTYNGESYWQSASSSLGASSTDFVIKPTEPGTYRYFVYAYRYVNGHEDPQGVPVYESDDIDEVYPSHSNVAEIAITQNDISGQPQQSPGDFSLSATADENGVALSWTKSTGATFYTVERRSDTSDAEFLEVFLDGAETSYLDRTAESGNVYTYVVTAQNSYDYTSRDLVIKAAGKSEDQLAAEEVSDLIGTLPDPNEIGLNNWEEFVDQANAISELYDSLTAKQRKLIAEDLREKLSAVLQKISEVRALAEYSEVIEPVQAAIDALPDAESITLDNYEEIRSQVRSARSAYSALPAEAKPAVALQRLTAAEAKIAEIEGYIEDVRTVQAVINEIGALDDADAFTKANVEAKATAVEAARTSYNALTAAQKELMAGTVEGGAAALSRLVDLETRVQELRDEIEADIVAANEVINLINGLPEDLALSDGEQVDAAAEAYDALTDDQKALIDAEVLQRLTEAETRIADLDAADKVAQMILALDPSAPLESAGDIEAARAAYNSLSPERKALISAAVLDRLSGCEETLSIRQQNAQEISDLQNQIGEKNNEIGDVQDVIDGLTGKLNALRNELGELEETKSELEGQIADLNRQLEDPDLSDEERDAINSRIVELTAQLEQVESQISAKEAEITAKGTEIGLKEQEKQQLESEKEALEDQLSEKTGDTDIAVAKNMIRSLPDVADITLDDEQAIADARAVYDALTDEQKAKIPQATVDKLITAEEKIRSLKPNKISSADITIPDVTYNGAAQQPAVTVVIDGNTLTKGVDYMVTYSDNTNAGTGKAVIEGIGHYTGTVEKTFNIAQKKITPAVTLSAANYTWDNKVKTPGVTVKDGNLTLAASQYSVAYAGGRKNIGAYKVTVTLKGNYSGSKALTFNIIPKGTSLSKASKAKKSFKAKWKKQTSKMPTAQITGYQIQCSTVRDFRSGVKTVNVKGAKKTSKKVGKLKAKTTYYVRVRTYMKVGGGTYYSAWSNVKAVKTK